MFQKEFKIGRTKVGGNNPVFIVAEIGINFNGKYENAIRLIDVAAESGCSAVKFQFFSAKKMYTSKAGDDKSGKDRKKNIYQIVKDAELPKNWIPKLKKYANKKGLEFFATVCDEEGADILDEYKADAYKIASYEITHVPLLRYDATKGKPIILAGAPPEKTHIADPLEVFREEKNYQIALLHCVAEYGAKTNSLNLDVISTFKKVFPNVVIGYSDHSSDPIVAPRSAVVLGAKIIEKHITLDKDMPGPDHFFALEPKELNLMVKIIRKTEKEIQQGLYIDISNEVLGVSERKTYDNEKGPRKFAYRCVFAIKDIKKNEKFTKKNIAVLRPGNQDNGLDPKYYELLLNGYRATKDIKINKSIIWNDILSK